MSFVFLAITQDSDGGGGGMYMRLPIALSQ